MTTQTLLIEQGAIETRAALLRDGVVVGFWFGPAVGGETRDQRPMARRTFIGCVRRIDQSLNAAFVDIGAEQDAFLPRRATDRDELTEGAWVRVRVVSAPRRAKGAVVELIGMSEAKAQPGRFNVAPAPIEAIAAVGAAGAEIITDSAEILRALTINHVDARMMQNAEAPGLFARYEVELALDSALAERVALAGGGTLHFFESEALVAIDVDTGATGASSSDRLREKIVADAAREAALQIERRNLAGRIVIDFPSIRTRSVRGRAIKEIEKALFAKPRITSSSIAGSNVVTLIRERRGASLWDETTEIAPIDPVPGRRFTAAWAARCAMRAAERRQQAQPGARLTLHTSAALAEYLQNETNAATAFSLRFGAHIEIVRDDQLGDRNFDISER